MSLSSLAPCGTNLSRLPGATYVLLSDEKERQRLAAQHQFLKHIFGGRNLLSPVTWVDGDNVLDSGTGTGIWLLELAKEVPKGIQLEGIDIEPHMFPSPEERPENLELSLHSMLLLPPDWTNRFKVVHQRLLAGGLKKEEWPLALKELHRVTKPGGWVELCEFIKWGGGPVNDQWWETMVKIMGKVGIQVDCGQHLESMVREAGFEDVQTVIRSCPMGPWGGEIGLMQMKSNLAVYEMLKFKMLTVAGDLLESEEEFDRLMNEMRREFEELKCTHEWVICFGKKAL